jgi:hypothetical protein
MRIVLDGHDLTRWDGAPRLSSVRARNLHGDVTAENVANGNNFLWRHGVM